MALIALLLASVQCLSACTLASCAPSSRDAQLPPCHRHHQVPVSNHQDNCDHQKAVSAPAADLDLAQLGLAPTPHVMPALIAAAPATLPEPLVLDSPPGLTAFSVLRI
jgi:hypothetical protein